MGVRLERTLMRACSLSMNRSTTSSVVVGVGDVDGCCTGVGCTAAAGALSAACSGHCPVRASTGLLGSAEGCESAGCWPAALIEAKRVTANNVVQVRMTSLHILN